MLWAEPVTLSDHTISLPLNPNIIFKLFLFLSHYLHLSSYLFITLKQALKHINTPTYIHILIYSPSHMLRSQQMRVHIHNIIFHLINITLSISLSICQRTRRRGGFAGWRGANIAYQSSLALPSRRRVAELTSTSIALSIYNTYKHSLTPKYTYQNTYSYPHKLTPRSYFILCIFCVAFAFLLPASFHGSREAEATHYVHTQLYINIYISQFIL